MGASSKGRETHTVRVGTCAQPRSSACRNMDSSASSHDPARNRITRRGLTILRVGVKVVQARARVLRDSGYLSAA